MKRYDLVTWIGMASVGKFDAPDVDTQIDAGWYDWWCSDASLVNKTKRLTPKVIALVRKMTAEKLINPEKVYLFFKGNMPGCGSAYDSFSLCDIETDTVLYFVSPKSGHVIDIETNQAAQIFDVVKGAAILSDTWNNLMKIDFSDSGNWITTEDA